MSSGARHRTGTMQFMAIEVLEGDLVSHGDGDRDWNDCIAARVYNCSWKFLE
jgi:hypothetical protein